LGCWKLGNGVRRIEGSGENKSGDRKRVDAGHTMREKRSGGGREFDAEDIPHIKILVE